MVQLAVLGRQGPIVSDQGVVLLLPRRKRDRSTARARRAGGVVKGQPPRQQVSQAQGEWPALIFAAKTTAAALIALLVAFTFNLDHPYWALLTVLSSRSRCRAGGGAGEELLPHRRHGEINWRCLSAARVKSQITRVERAFEASRGGLAAPAKCYGLSRT